MIRSSARRRAGLRLPHGPGARLRVVALALTTGLAFLVAPAAAQGPSAASADPPNFTQEWRWSDYGEAEHVPEGIIRGMADDGERIWLHTSTEVAWFDGFEWETAEGLPTRQIRSLHALPGTPVAVAADSGLWVGNTQGFARVDLPGLPPGSDVLEVAWADSTVLLFVVQTPDAERTGQRLYMRRGGLVSPVETPGFLHTRSRTLLSSEGGAYLVAGGGLFRHVAAGRWEEVLRRPRAFIDVGVLAVNADGVAVANLEDGSRSLVTWDRDTAPGLVPSEGQSRLMGAAVTPAGVRLAIHDTGHLRVGAGDSWSDANLPTARAQGVYHVFVSSAGEVWIASLQGLHHFRGRDRRWSRIQHPFPSQRNRINAILMQEGGDLWLGTGAGVIRHSRGVNEEYFELGGESLAAVTSLAEDPDGGVWFSSGGDFIGAYRVAPDGSWTHLGEAHGLGYVHGVLADSAGNVHFLVLRGGDGPGVVRLDRDGVLTRLMDPRRVLASSVYASAEAPDGTLWFGGAGGIARLRDGVWASWTGEDLGTGQDRMWAMAVSPQGELWVSPGPEIHHVLSVFDESTGRLVPKDSDDRLAARAVWSIRFDDEGGMWVGTSTGLSYRKDGVWARFDGRHGLGATQVWPVVPTGSQVMVGTANGMMILSRGEEADPAPRVFLSGGISDDELVEFSWVVHGFRGKPPSDEIEVRYALDDAPWTRWNRERSVQFGDLGPGVHTLRVQAKGLFGQLSEVTSATVRVPLPVYLRPPVAIPGAVLALGLLLLAVQLRFRRMQRDQAMRESEGRLRALLEQAPEAILLHHGTANRIVEANEQAHRLLGYDQRELAGLSPTALCPDAQPTGVRSQETLYRLLAQALAEGEFTEVEWTFLHRDGHPVHTRLHLARLPEPESHLVRMSLVDLTRQKAAEAARRELEVQLVQAQKLEAVGQLTGGLAHDFNNLLTVIRGNLEFLRADGASEQARRFADQALRAAERGSQLVRRLLAFSMRQTLEPRRVVLRDALEDLLPLVRRAQGESVEVNLRVSPEVGEVVVDRSQLDSAVMNLGLNARDAMPSGGTLNIGAEVVEVGAGMADAAEVDPGAYVRLTVSDTGTGMPAELVDRVFEPFFTTKEVGKGSGLGLSMVYGFARQSGGFARITSEVGRGTQVHLYFPVAAPTDGEEEAAGPHRGQGNGTRASEESLRVLVVEDDASLRTLLEGLLRHMGHRVAAAGTAQEAELLVSRGFTPDVLLSDVILPGPRSGPDLAADLRRRLPGLGVGFISGYDPGSLPRSLDPALPFLAKPFDQNELATLLEEALGREPSARSR